MANPLLTLRSQVPQQESPFDKCGMCTLMNHVRPWCPREEVKQQIVFTLKFCAPFLIRTQEVVQDASFQSLLRKGNLFLSNTFHHAAEFMIPKMPIASLNLLNTRNARQINAHLTVGIVAGFIAFAKNSGQPELDWHRLCFHQLQLLADQILSGQPIDVPTAQSVAAELANLVKIAIPVKKRFLLKAIGNPGLTTDQLIFTSYSQNTEQDITVIYWDAESTVLVDATAQIVI